MCRSRRELSNAYFRAKFGFDTAENEPCKVCPIEQCSISIAQVVRAAADLCADRDAAVRPGDDPGLPPGVGRDVPLEAEELGLFVFWRDHGPHLALGGSALGGGSGEPGSARRTQTLREITSHALPRNH